MDVAIMGPTMGMSVLVFMAIWVVMMAAMMFPTAAPMIVTFTRVHAARRARGQSYVPTWVFVGAYFAVWTSFGGLAYALAVAGQSLAELSPWLMMEAARIGGIALVLAGLYQLSPLKQMCLAKCRTPLAFILGAWREGYGGALRMGLEHGIYCLGCCWLLFVILFPLGMMNVAAMALITLLIFAEKSLPDGARVGKLAAVALIGYGIVVIAVPGTLPTFAPMAPDMTAGPSMAADSAMAHGPRPVTTRSSHRRGLPIGRDDSANASNVCRSCSLALREHQTAITSHATCSPRRAHSGWSISARGKEIRPLCAAAAASGSVHTGVTIDVLSF
jgi:predicted metal-binding membrane protein